MFYPCFMTTGDVKTAFFETGNRFAETGFLAVPRRRLIVQRCPTGGGRWFPGPSSAGPIAVALLRSRSPVPSSRPFWARNCRPMLIIRRRDGVLSSAGNGARSGRWSPLPLCAPAGDPTPITQVKVRTRAKLITSFSLSKPVPGFKTGYRFSGSRLTSLMTTPQFIQYE